MKPWRPQFRKPRKKKQTEWGSWLILLVWIAIMLASVGETGWILAHRDEATCLPDTNAFTVRKQGPLDL